VVEEGKLGMEEMNKEQGKAKIACLTLLFVQRTLLRLKPSRQYWE
jgi:hypothetical protein